MTDDKQPQQNKTQFKVLCGHLKTVARTLGLSTEALRAEMGFIEWVTLRRLELAKATAAGARVSAPTAQQDADDRSRFIQEVEANAAAVVPLYAALPGVLTIVAVTLAESSYAKQIDQKQRTFGPVFAFATAVPPERASKAFGIADRRAWYLSQMYVLPHYQHLGIGCSLLKHMRKQTDGAALVLDVKLKDAGATIAEQFWTKKHGARLCTEENRMNDLFGDEHSRRFVLDARSTK